MSTFYSSDITCAMCGKTSEHDVMGSTNSMGYMDLDMRPAPMERNTMFTWIQACPHCGYVNFSIDEPPLISKEFLESEAYKTADGHDMPTLAQNFYRQALMFKECNDVARTFHAYKHAAWVCDDARSPEAVTMRLLALEVLTTASAGEIYAKEESHIMKAELLRRTNQFDKVLALPATQFSSAFLQQLFDFEKALAEKHDNRCHNVGEVLPQEHDDNENDDLFDDTDDTLDDILFTSDDELFLTFPETVPVGTKVTIGMILDWAPEPLRNELHAIMDDIPPEELTESMDEIIAVVVKEIPAGTSMEHTQLYDEFLADV